MVNLEQMIPWLLVFRIEEQKQILFSKDWKLVLRVNWLPFKKIREETNTRVLNEITVLKLVDNNVYLK